MERTTVPDQIYQFTIIVAACVAKAIFVNYRRQAGDREANNQKVKVLKTGKKERHLKSATCWETYLNDWRFLLEVHPTGFVEVECKDLGVGDILELSPGETV